MNKKKKSELDIVKTVKRMSRNEFLLKPSVVFKSMNTYRRKSRHKKDYMEDYK